MKVPPFLRSKGMRKVMTGAPVIIFLAGGSVLLAQFVQGRVEAKDRKLQSKSVREFDIEEEYKRTMAKLDIDNYKIVRIQRPDE